jgi:transcription elongation GreA/GreB family factor
LIEDQEIPEDVVAPGNRVEMVEEETGKRRTYTLLGPWDTIDDHTINYKAPIAHGILGLRVGDTGELPAPSGPIPVRIESIERAI